jgi:AcrR family transcriptional regulator
MELMVQDGQTGEISEGAATRKSSTERLAETRARLLDAVLVTLAERGYAGTSTSEVARRSGLTRGAQLHHFGTKDLMMVAAVNHLERQIKAVDVAAALADVPSGPPRVHFALAIMSELFAGVLPEAYVQLWVASRSLNDLTDALRAQEVVARDTIRSLFGQELLENAGAEFEALLDLTLYALRGMSLDAHLTNETERRARSDLIRDMEPYFDQALGLEAGKGCIGN